MAVVLTAGTPAESTGSVSSITVTLPPGLVAGDYTILVASLNASSGVIDTPAGWDEIFASASSTASSSHAVAVFARKWVPGDTNPVITSSNGRIGVLPVRVQGADATTMFEAVASTSQSSATTAVVAPSVTPTVANSVLCVVASGRSASNNIFITWDPPTGMTEVGEAGGKSTSNQTNASGSLNTLALTTAGVATGTKTATASSTATGSRGIAFIIRPAATVSTAGKVKVYIGGAWVSKPLKVWNGSAWVAKPVKVNRNGTWGLSK